MRGATRRGSRRRTIAGPACRRDFVFENTDPTVVDDYVRQSSTRHLEALLPDTPIVTGEQFAELTVTNFGDNLLGEPTAVLVPRRAFERYGIFKTDLVEACDLEYWMRVGCHEGVVYVPETLAWFRVHAGATSAVNRRQRVYRRSTLDPAILWHDVATLPVYAPLRAAGLAAEPPVDFDRELAHTH